MKNATLILLIGVMLISSSCKKTITGCVDDNASNYDSEANSDCCCTYLVKYSVSGSSGDYDVTYENSGGGTSQNSNVPSGWSYSFTGSPDDFVYISAQNNNNSGSVLVTITKGSDVFETSSSSGAYVIATASGSL